MTDLVDESESGALLPRDMLGSSALVLPQSPRTSQSGREASLFDFDAFLRAPRRGVSGLGPRRARGVGRAVGDDEAVGAGVGEEEVGDGSGSDGDGPPIIISLDGPEDVPSEKGGEGGGAQWDVQRAAELRYESEEDWSAENGTADEIPYGDRISLGKSSSSMQTLPPLHESMPHWNKSGGKRSRAVGNAFLQAQSRRRKRRRKQLSRLKQKEKLENVWGVPFFATIWFAALMWTWLGEFLRLLYFFSMRAEGVHVATIFAVFLWLPGIPLLVPRVRRRIADATPAFCVLSSFCLSIRFIPSVTARVSLLGCGVTLSTASVYAMFFTYQRDSAAVAVGFGLVLVNILRLANASVNPIFFSTGFDLFAFAFSVALVAAQVVHWAFMRRIKAKRLEAELDLTVASAMHAAISRPQEELKRFGTDGGPAPENDFDAESAEEEGSDVEDAFGDGSQDPVAPTADGDALAGEWVVDERAEASPLVPRIGAIVRESETESDSSEDEWLALSGGLLKSEEIASMSPRFVARPLGFLKWLAAYLLEFDRTAESSAMRRSKEPSRKRALLLVLGRLLDIVLPSLGFGAALFVLLWMFSSTSVVCEWAAINAVGYGIGLILTMMLGFSFSASPLVQKNVLWFFFVGAVGIAIVCTVEGAWAFVGAMLVCLYITSFWGKVVRRVSHAPAALTILFSQAVFFLLASASVAVKGYHYVPGGVILRWHGSSMLLLACTLLILLGGYTLHDLLALRRRSTYSLSVPRRQIIYLVVVFCCLLVSGVVFRFLYFTMTKERIPAHSTLNIATLNVHQGFSADGSVNFGKIARFVVDNAVDVLCLQESETIDLCMGNNDLVEYLSARIDVRDARSTHLRGYWGTTVLTNLDLLGWDVHELSSRSSTGENGIALQARVKFRYKELRVFDAHIGKTNQAGQTAQLLEAFPASSADVEVFGVGDFNSEPHSVAYESIVRDFIDACFVANNGSYVPTRFGAAAWRTVDYVFFHSASDLHLQSCRVLRDEWDRSPHRPVLARFALGV